MTNNLVEFIEFKPWHLLGINNPNFDARNFFRGMSKDDKINYGLYAIAVAPADFKPITCVEVNTGNIVGCGGVSQWSETTREAWLILDESIKKHPFSTFKFIKKKLDQMDTPRVQCYVNSHTVFTRAYSFAKALGFNQEAVLEKAGDSGNDLILFKRIKQCN